MTSHRLDPLSLFAGLLFVAVGVVSLAGGLPLLLTGQWLLPGALIALGVGVLLTVTSDGRPHPDEPRSDGAAPEHDRDDQAHDPEHDPEHDPASGGGEWR